MEEMGPLQFGVEKSKMNWGTYFQDAMRTRGTASSQFKDYSDRGPSVVVQNAYGVKWVLEVTKNVKEARARAVAVENDYRTLGPAQWCERYGIPASFLTEGLRTQDMGKTIAAVGGEAHGDEPRHQVYEEAQHRDEDLDEILQNMKIPIESDPPPNTQSD
jgi:hypothetical protein